mmetsp:Transcript_24222/g.75521  ORF Transcript_24222/g.75521 Transcript_24222/m.75521 type:complete len:248 (-) Transcript_24222:53-796(-)
MGSPSLYTRSPPRGAAAVRTWWTKEESPMAGAAKVTSTGRRGLSGVDRRATCTAATWARAPPREWPVMSTRPPVGSASSSTLSMSVRTESNALRNPLWQCAPPPQLAGNASRSVKRSPSSLVPRKATVTRPSPAGRVVGCGTCPRRRLRTPRAIGSLSWSQDGTQDGRQDSVQHTRGETTVRASWRRARSPSTGKPLGCRIERGCRRARSTSHALRAHASPTVTPSEVAARLYGARARRRAPWSSAG